MRYAATIALALLANVTSAQQFEEVSKSVGLEMITSFAENREKFSSFACRGTVTVEKVTSFDEVFPTCTHFAVLENHAKRSARSIYSIQDLYGDLQPPTFQDVFRIKGKQTLIRPGGRFYPDEEYSEHMIKLHWLPKDPWSWSFIGCASLVTQLEDALLWMQVFREDKLLWVEDNGKLIRAEWDVGPRGRIQAYFDPGKGDMPVYCRIIIPINKEEKFGKKTRLAFNEIETEWTKHLDGWVPVKVRNYRESLDEKGKVSGSETWNFSLDWNSKLMKDGVVIDDVFEIGKLEGSQILDSFSKGTSPKRD